VRPLRFAADLAVGTVVLAAVPVAAVGRRVHEVASPAIAVVRDDLARQVGAVLDRVVPVAVTEVVQRIDLNELVEKYVDVERLVAGLDLATLTNQVLAQIDLPEIIRESTGSVASETIRGVRMQAISADDVVARLGSRLRLRKPTPALPTPALPLPGPAEPVPPVGP
jgi:hypothetical protein